MKKINIAIDGPSGAGKSSLAKRAAKHFSIIYVDTGAMYRCIGLYALQSGVASKDTDAVTALLPEIKISMDYDETGTQRMFLNGKDVTDEIREPEVSIYASDVSAMPAVRGFLLEMQRSIARENSVIMDGRDIGTVVLPDADIKIFISATPQERARRRFRELYNKGIVTTFDDVLRDIKYRDENDTNRAIAPLKAADDAIKIDTTGNTFAESFALLISLIEENM